MRWTLPVCLLFLYLVGCTPARYVCKDAAALRDPTPELTSEQCPLAGATFDYENLAIEGGGVKGIAYGGALEVLQQARILGPGSKLRRVAGTSAGSITALLIALGYSASEVRTILMDLDVEKFKDDGAAGPARLLKDFGWYSGEFYRTWVECQVQRKMGKPDATFLDLHQKARSEHLPELYVVVTDLNHSNWRVLSYETVPCMPVALAARLSGSLPFFWNALRLDLSNYRLGPGDTCRPTDGTRGKLDVFTDGGTLLNYPLPLFDSAFFINGGDPNAEEVNPKTLGLHLDPPPNQRVPDLRIDSFPDYARAVLEAALQVQIDDFEHSPCDMVRSVRINDLGIGTTDFDLTPEQKKRLIHSGFENTCKYLQNPGDLKKACPSLQPSRAPWVPR